MQARHRPAPALHKPAHAAGLCNLDLGLCHPLSREHKLNGLCYHVSRASPVLTTARSTAATVAPQTSAEPIGCGAHQVTISKDDTIVLDGAGDKSAITERCDQIREAAESSTSDYDRSAAHAISISPDKHHSINSMLSSKLCFLLSGQLSS